MALKMELRAVKEARLDVDAVRMRLLNALRAEGRDHAKMLKETVKTWKGPKPKFVFTIHLDRRIGASVETYPTGNADGIQKWIWLDQGTRVRHAVMSRDFDSKTFPGWFGSGKGSGKMVFVSRKLKRPGIKARRWSLELAKDRQLPFGRRMQEAMGGAYFIAGYSASTPFESGS